LILHGHTPRLGYRDEKHVPPDQVLESGRFSGQSRLRFGLGGQQRVAFDPQRTSRRSDVGAKSTFVTKGSTQGQ
jgi:hypothetical protein